MAKENYSDKDRAIVAALKANLEGLTLAELREITGMDLKAGHISGAVKKNLIEVIGDRDVERLGKGKVMSYKFITDAALAVDGKAHNYSPSEKEILATASKFEGAFTLNELGTAMGRKLSSGNITGLVKKGNLAKGDYVEVERKVKSTVNVYGFVKDVPDEAKNDR